MNSRLIDKIKNKKKNKKENNTDKDDKAIKWDTIPIRELLDDSLGDAILDKEIRKYKEIRELEEIQRPKNILLIQD